GALRLLCAHPGRRERGGRARLRALALGGVGVAAVLGPVAWPYVVVHRDLGYERDINDAAGHSADLFTFVEAGNRSLLYPWAPGGHIAETSLFVGFTVLALAAGAGVWLRRRRPLPPGV